MFWHFDYYYLVLVLPAMIWAMWAQSQVSSTFSKYGRMRSRCGLSGAQIARRILDRNGLASVRVEHVGGNLSDHYDPSAQVVRLSDSVYSSDSVAALGVAAHECGHAVQHAQQYRPLTIRNTIIPITNIGSKMAIPIFLLGLFFNQTLCTVGILLFGLVALVQLITLPVEFNASARALDTLEGAGFLDNEELRGSQKVLRAAALTYVAALAVTIAQLLRLVMIAGRRRDD